MKREEKEENHHRKKSREKEWDPNKSASPIRSPYHYHFIYVIIIIIDIDIRSFEWVNCLWANRDLILCPSFEHTMLHTLQPAHTHTHTNIYRIYAIATRYSSEYWLLLFLALSLSPAQSPFVLGSYFLFDFPPSHIRAFNHIKICRAVRLLHMTFSR